MGRRERRHSMRDEARRMKKAERRMIAKGKKLFESIKQSREAPLLDGDLRCAGVSLRQDREGHFFCDADEKLRCPAGVCPRGRSASLGRREPS